MRTALGRGSLVGGLVLCLYACGGTPLQTAVPAAEPSAADPDPSASTVIVPVAPPTASANAAAPPALDEFGQLVRDVWTRLGRSRNGCPEDYDYYPDGGLRNFACHMKTLTSYDVLGRLSGQQVYLSGPHSNAALVLNSKTSFGHYNPDFVRWMVDRLVPAASDPALRDATQPLYERLVRPLAHAFQATWLKIQREPACFEKEKKRYEEALKRKKVPDDFVERYFYFMNSEFCRRPEAGYDYFGNRGFDGGYDGNVVKTCVGFWIRRSLDGTAAQFARGLEQLLRTYDPESVTSVPPSRER